MLPGRTPNQYDMEVRLKKPALVLLHSTWLPGWRVRVDGAKAEPTLLANSWMSGVLVESGTHRVSFYYRPVHFRLGLGMSALGCVALLGVLLFGRGLASGAATPGKPDA
jgi:uncharacterized membrane protein YfhO